MTRILQNPAEGSREVIDRELARMEQSRAPKIGRQRAAHQDVVRLLGDLDADKIAAILALRPDLSDLEEAAAWMAGEGDVPAQEGHPLAGKAAAIFDIVEPAERDIDLH